MLEASVLVVAPGHSAGAGTGPVAEEVVDVVKAEAGSDIDFGCELESFEIAVPAAAIAVDTDTEPAPQLGSERSASGSELVMVAVPGATAGIAAAGAQIATGPQKAALEPWAEVKACQTASQVERRRAT